MPLTPTLVPRNMRESAVYAQAASREGKCLGGPTDFRKTAGSLCKKVEMLGKLFTLMGQAGFWNVLSVPSNRALHSGGDSVIRTHTL